MGVQIPFHLGLIVRSGVYEQRSPRTQLDVALLAATLNFNLSLYFVGTAVLQLASHPNSRNMTAAALLPVGYRAWASLPELFEHAKLEVFAEPIWLERLQNKGLPPYLPVQPCEVWEMRLHWSACDRLLVL